MLSILSISSVASIFLVVLPKLTHCGNHTPIVSDTDPGILMLLQKGIHVHKSAGGNSTSLKDGNGKVHVHGSTGNSSALLQHGGSPASLGFTKYYEAAPLEATDSSAQVLLFWPVGSSDRVMDLIRMNVDHVHKQLAKADVFLVHYDLQKALWMESNTTWYEQNVKFSVDRAGYKFQLLRSLIFEEDGFAEPDQYSWIWCLDEDIDFHAMNLPRMFAVADTSGALLTIPAFMQGEDNNHGDRDLDYPIQLPRSHCQYRYTPFVEVIFPLIRPIVLKLLLTECEHCVHNNSFWGLDCVWCEWSAKRLGSPVKTACAIIDETPALHMNFKTMSSKYSGTSHAESKTFLNMAMRDRDDVRAHHPDEYVDMKEHAWSHCVEK